MRLDGATPAASVLARARSIAADCKREIEAAVLLGRVDPAAARWGVRESYTGALGKLADLGASLPELVRDVLVAPSERAVLDAAAEALESLPGVEPHDDQDDDAPAPPVRRSGRRRVADEIVADQRRRWGAGFEEMVEAE